jgi:hypothetical protein
LETLSGKRTSLGPKIKVIINSDSEIDSILMPLELV